jgi:F420-dependent oxidoreductase-like protein
MKIGLQLPWFDWPGSPANIGSTLAAIAETADAGGFASIWVMDHLFQIQGIGEPSDQMLESYSTLGFLAGHTSRARLGTLVTGAPYRPPGLLIKAVTTLDVLSGGRAWLGIGAGWNEHEAIGLGLPFPPLNERFERLEETLQIAHHMWSGNTSPYHGQHYTLEEPINSPPVLSKPHPPILIGGSGERKTLRLVAQYADACNLFPGDPAEMRRKLDVLKRHCDDVGRDYDTIERTALVFAAPSAAGWRALIEQCRVFSGIGIQHAILTAVPVHEISVLESIGREVIPEVADL